MAREKGITLIELLVSIAIATVIIAAIYFSLNASLESWGYSRDQLALQKVLFAVMADVVSGTPDVYGIKDSLEIRDAGLTKMEFVSPWTDDTHSAVGREFVYTLNRKMKPGSGVPVAEISFPGSGTWRNVAVKEVELEDSVVSQVKLGMAVPPGSQIRFTYHPDADSNADVGQKIWWDKDESHVYFENRDGVKKISENSMDVKISDMRLRYYDNRNSLVSESDWVDRSDLNMISGVELFLEAELGQYKRSLVSFINLRNAPTRSGYLPLKKGTRVRIPDSGTIHTLLVSNISGVSGGDELELEAKPSSGKVWRINIKFSRPAKSRPKIESYTIEYPQQTVVYTGYPRTNADMGLDLLTLGTDGLFDYDNDEDTEDVVLLEGDVTCTVTKMDVEGAALFVRP